MLTIGSLCSGIGGLELGLEQAGLGPVLWQCEIDPYCRAVLRRHWPNAELHEDVTQLDGSALASVGVVCFGAPCQDLSGAGKGAGLHGSRSRLVFDCLRVVSVVRPEWVVVENVASGARRWVDTVVRELEQLGYACLPVPIAAADCGAPHLRRRIFIVAHADGVGQGRLESGRKRGPRLKASTPGARSDGGSRDTANSNSVRKLQPEGSISEQWGRADHQAKIPTSDSNSSRREGSRPESYTRGERFASGGWLSSEPDVGRVVHGLPGGLDGHKRRARVRSLGNAVVPQCAEVVGWMIRELG